MREEIASVVFPVLTYGLHLKERISSEEPPDLGAAQSELQGLLSDGAAARFPDFTGAGSVSAPFGRAGASGGDRFLGIRYALVCWLDEIMIRDTSWKDDWTDRTLEQALYDSRDRAWNFWVQADRAAREGRTDALEAFYLCAMLGFRGEKDNPAELQGKLREYQEQIDSGGGKDWPGPVGGQPRVFAPPLIGAEHKRRMLRWAITALLVVIPIIVFCLVYAFRS